jgi:Holliday junction resolvasome RuvABC ATP-dependent DNA helicase subunit
MTRVRRACARKRLGEYIGQEKPRAIFRFFIEAARRR